MKDTGDPVVQSLQFGEFVLTGRLSFSGRAKDVINELARIEAEKLQRVCLSCGASQDSNGKLPCGH